MHNSSHHIQSKRQSAPIKNPLFPCQSTLILSVALVMLNLTLVILSKAKNLLLHHRLLPDMTTLVMLNHTLAMLSLYFVILSKAKNLPSPTCIPIEVSAGNVLWTRLCLEQRL